MAITGEKMAAAYDSSSFSHTWHRWVHRLCVFLFFSKVTVHNEENIPKSGPVIYLGLHRNGAVDGFIYHGVVPGITALISRQLRGSLFFRFFFSGIEVVREKDLRPGENATAANQASLQACVAHLKSNGELLMFPEGTSTLGPRHLPFKSGAYRIAADFVADSKQPLTLVPMGIRYERAWEFRSRVEVTIGTPIVADAGNIRQVRRQCNDALADIGVNVADEACQERIHKLAYVATLGTAHSYYEILKHFEKSIPPALDVELREIERLSVERRLWQHQGVPLFPIGPRWPYALALLLSGPIVALALVLNALPLTGGWWAAQRFADDRNVIALWKILIGLPLAAINVIIITVSGLAMSAPLALAAYLVVSSLGLLLFYRTRKLAVAVRNGLLHPGLQARAAAFREAVLTELASNHNHSATNGDI